MWPLTLSSQERLVHLATVSPPRNSNFWSYSTTIFCGGKIYSFSFFTSMFQVKSLFSLYLYFFFIPCYVYVDAIFHSFSLTVYVCTDFFFFSVVPSSNIFSFSLTFSFFRSPLSQFANFAIMKVLQLPVTLTLTWEEFGGHQTTDESRTNTKFNLHVQHCVCSFFLSLSFLFSFPFVDWYVEALIFLSIFLNCFAYLEVLLLFLFFFSFFLLVVYC